MPAPRLPSEPDPAHANLIVPESESPEEPDAKEKERIEAERAAYRRAGERVAAAPATTESEALDRRSVSAAVVHEAVRLEGEEELDRTTAALFWSALASGLSLGLSMTTMGLLRAGMPMSPWRPLVADFGYVVGFFVVVLGRQQLFTEDTLTPILPLLHRWSRLWDVARLWLVVLVANLIGAYAYAWLAGNTLIFAEDVRLEFTALGRELIQPGFGTSFLRATLAGWLIALMVWLLPASGPARLAAIVIPTYIIALGRFGHSIAGSVDVLYLVATAQASWATYLGRFLAPVLLGNIVGGVLLVALLNHAQVAAGKKRSPTR